MSEKSTKLDFGEESIKTMADAMEEAIENSDNEPKVGQSELLDSVAEVSNYYNIPHEKRTDFAIRGLERVLERQKTKVLSDFRETLEGLGRIWERKE